MLEQGAKAYNINYKKDKGVLRYFEFTTHLRL